MFFGWDRKYIKKLRKLGIRTELYNKHLDDIFCDLEGIEKGGCYDKKINQITYNPKLFGDRLKDCGKRTSDIIAEISNSPEPRIQLTTNSQERNPDVRMAVLDLK